jgi:hypothetical protein
VVTHSAFSGTAQNTAASFQVTGIRGLMAEMRRRGVVFEDYDLPDFKTVDGVFIAGPVTVTWFKDSDGNIIEMTEVASEQ